MSVETSAAPRAFPPTRWSLVLAAREGSGESRAALEDLCRAYWYPLYAFARLRGCSPHDAQDITQEFFCRLLEKNWLAAADPARGRLRTFLVVALKHFISNEWRQASALRRGGGQTPIQIDTEFAESRYAVDPAATSPGEESFDRQWAMTLLERTVERLRKEFADIGRADDFAVLKDCLMAVRGTIDYEEVASRLRVNAGAARVAVHRLRKRFREIYREEIIQTLPEGANVDEEVRHLAAALAAGGQ
jgi:RNA polymerase sigma factor (sigma-70 family)